MKVLVTGADGYIGRALSRRLGAAGASLQGRDHERWGPIVKTAGFKAD